MGIPLMGASNAGGVDTNRDSGRIAGYLTAAVHDQQLTVVGAVVYHSYGAHLFTAQIATHQLLLAYADYRTCHRNSATPRIRHQQSVVSLVCHLISSGDMIPLCGTSSERHHTHIGCYQPDPRACGRRRSVLGLFWSDLEYLGRLNPGGWIVRSWTETAQLTAEVELQSSHHWETMSTGSMSNRRGVTMLADVEVDEGGHCYAWCTVALATSQSRCFNMA